MASRSRVYVGATWFVLAARCPWLAPAEEVADEVAVPKMKGDYVCQCEFKDNNWIHTLTNVLRHVQNLPEVLLDSHHPSTDWILRQSCVEDAAAFPNTQLALDINDVVRLRDAAGMPSSQGRLEVHQLCLPGQVVMSMVCSQQWLVKRSLMGVIKWVGKMTELLSVVHECMDADSPVPLRAADFKEFLQTFNKGVPKPEDPSFVAFGAFRANARLKTYDEAEEPLHECIPIKEPNCFPRNTLNIYESCQECCHPQKGSTGDVNCWSGPFTYDLCCHHSPRPWKVEVKEATCADQDERNRELAKSLEHEAIVSRDLSKALGSTKEELRTCQEEAVVAGKRIILLDEEVVQLQALNKELNASLAAQAEKHSQLEEQLTRQRREIDTLTAEKGALAEEEAKQREQVKELQEEVDALQLEMGESREHSAGVSQDAESLKAKLETAKQDLSRLSAELQLSQAQAQQREEELPAPPASTTAAASEAEVPSCRQPDDWADNWTALSEFAWCLVASAAAVLPR